MAITENKSNLEEIDVKIRPLERRINLFRLLAWAFVISGIIIFLYCIWLWKQAEHRNDLGDFGSLVGGSVTSVWSLAGLFFIYLAFLGQQKELIYQREEIRQNMEELQLTRLELRGQREEMERQNLTLAKQSFENGFFEFMKIYRETISELILSWSSTYRDPGKNQFMHFLREYHQMYNNSYPNKNIVHSPDIPGLKSVFKLRYERSQENLEDYFRQLWTWVKFTADSNLSDRSYYLQLIAAQFSKYELRTVYFYCGCLEEGYQLKSIFLQYNLFKNLDEDDWIKNVDMTL